MVCFNARIRKTGKTTAVITIPRQYFKDNTFYIGERVKIEIKKIIQE